MNRWTYHAVLSDGEDSMGEVGPFATATDALTWACSSIGKLARDLSAPVTVDLSCPLDAGPVVGFTLERWNGEDTDGEWGINGGRPLKRRVWIVDQSGATFAFWRKADAQAFYESELEGALEDDALELELFSVDSPAALRDLADIAERWLNGTL